MQTWHVLAEGLGGGAWGAAVWNVLIFPAEGEVVERCGEFSKVSPRADYIGHSVGAARHME